MKRGKKVTVSGGRLLSHEGVKAGDMQSRERGNDREKYGRGLEQGAGKKRIGTGGKQTRQ